MPTSDDLDRLLAEEKALHFPHFNAETAWSLGKLIHDTAAVRDHAVAIEIVVNGQKLFFSALPGATLNNEQWIRRKGAVARMFQHSSLFKTWEADVIGKPFNARYALPEDEYAASGGAMPIFVAGTGCVGTVVVSGLPMVEDHKLIVECMTKLIAEMQTN